jgi:hypothetical protein
VTKPYWVNVYPGGVLGVICTERWVAAHCAAYTRVKGLQPVAYRLHITPTHRVAIPNVKER